MIRAVTIYVQDDGSSSLEEIVEDYLRSRGWRIASEDEYLEQVEE